MKKFCISLAVLLSVSIFCTNKISAQVHTRLPDNVLEFLNTHFGSAQIVFQDQDAFDYSFIIQLDNGFETDFYREGSFKLIDGQGEAVPQTIIEDFPEQLRNYLKEHFPKEKIVVLKQDMKRNIEIVFENKTVVQFDKYGAFLSETKSK